MAISLGLFIVVLPSWMSKRNESFRVNVTIAPGTFDAKHFYIDQQDTSIRVHAVVTDQEFEDLNSGAYAEADLSKAVPGTNQYPVSLYPPKFRKAVTGVIPNATFKLEALISPEVPVTVISSGKLNDPMLILDSMKPDRSKVTIEGPESNVKRVVSARATLRLDILDPHTTQQVVALEPVDNQGQVVDRVDVHPPQMMVTPQFSLSPQQKQVFVHASFDNHELPPGFEVKNYFVNPPNVIATGSSFALSRIGTSINTEKIDVSKLTGSQTLIVPLRSFGTGLTFSPSTVQVTINVVPLSLNGFAPKSSSNRPTARAPDSPGAPQ